MKIGIIGAGAVGAIIATELSNLDVELKLMARSNRDGLTIKTGETVQYHKIIVYDIDTVDDKFDLIFIASKTPALKDLQDKIPTLMHEDTEIVFALNGMGYDNMFSHGVPAVVYISGQQKEDYIEHFLNKKLLIENKQYKALDTLIEQMQENPSVELQIVKTEDFKRIRYEKLIVNTGVNTVTALSQNTARIFKDQSVVMFTRQLLNEAIDIVNNCNPDGVIIDEDFIDTAMNMYLGYPAHMGTSMYYDVIQDKPTEFQYIQGFLMTLKGNCSIHTPILDTVTLLLKAYEIRDN